MDWKAEDEDRQALARIAALLVSLAALAEYACGRSHLLRCLILWILRPAEECARNFVGGGVLSPAGDIEPPALLSAGGAVVELMRLAASFQALALAVRRLARQTQRLGRELAHRRAALRRLPQIVPCAPGKPTFTAPWLVDTS